jgi:hypothetical protein
MTIKSVFLEGLQGLLLIKVCKVLNKRRSLPRLENKNKNLKIQKN